MAAVCSLEVRKNCPQSLSRHIMSCVAQICSKCELELQTSLDRFHYSRVKRPLGSRSAHTGQPKGSLNLARLCSQTNEGQSFSLQKKTFCCLNEYKSMPSFSLSARNATEEQHESTTRLIKNMKFCVMGTADDTKVQNKLRSALIVGAKLGVKAATQSWN